MRVTTMKHFLCLSLFFSVSAGALVERTSVNDFGLVHWLTSNGGMFNPKQELRYDATSQLGIFATETIKEGEVLVQIPLKLCVGPEATEEVDEDDDFYCVVVQKVAKEMEKGAASKFAPYMNYLSSLLDTGPTIPSAWSAAGKALLMEIMGGEDLDFPPRRPTQLLDAAWSSKCDGEPDLEPVAGLVMQQDTGDYMIPIYGLYTHRNGEYYNIEVDYEDGEYFQLLASRDIVAGEQLHDSHDLCDECDAELVDLGYGTPGNNNQGQRY
jgi:hypothetical protein